MIVQATRSTTIDDSSVVGTSSASTVAALTPDTVALSQVRTRGVVVTVRAEDGEHDFVSRFFGPAAGVPEDP